MKAKRIFKIVLIVLACILFLYTLMLLFFMPFYAPNYPSNIEFAKKGNVFIEEYKIDMVEIIDSAFNFPYFKSIFLTKTQMYERNKFGMVHLVPSNNKILVFVLKNEDNKLFLTENCGQTWFFRDDYYEIYGGNLGGVINVRLAYDEIRYIDLYNFTVYVKKNHFSIKKEDLIPVLKFKLVPKENEN
jgi:hypothetical protein